MAVARAHGDLLERDHELQTLEAQLAAAAAGAGGLVIVEGAAGIGKTELLSELTRRAEAAGTRVLLGRSSELERDLGFGIVHQLFEPVLRKLGPETRVEVLAGPAGVAAQALGLAFAESDPAHPPASAGDEFSVLNGLYWLTANLAELGPLLIVVDDAQVCDRPSARWLGYLGRRVGDLRGLLVLCTRPAEPGDHRDAVEAVAGEPGTVHLTLGPLGPQSISELLSREYPEPPDPAFTAACHTATGGNPFLAAELIRAAAEAEIAPTAGAARRILDMTPETIGRTLSRRLDRLPPQSLALARAVAVLGTRIELRHAAALARLDIADAGEAADRLTAAHVLAPARPLDFLHPIVAGVVREQIPAGERALAHARAARLLADDGASAERVALHLLSSEPAGDEWVVATLREAAAGASPETAVGFLRRALAEPAPAGLRGELLLELGELETLAFEPLETAMAHLREGLAATENPAARARAALALSGALLDAGDPAAALEVILAPVAKLAQIDPPPGSDDHELWLRGEAMRLTCEDLLGHPPDTAAFARLRDLAGEGSTPGERVLLANLAYDGLVVGTSATEAAALALRAIEGDRLLEERLYFDHHVATWTLEYADDLEAAARSARAALEETRRRGSVGEHIFALTVHGVVANRRGALRDAEADARTALHLAAEHGLSPDVVSFTWALLIDVLTDRGEYADADAAVSTCGFSADEPASPVRAFYFHARGRLRSARGRVDEALADFAVAGRMMRDQSLDHPAFYPWRSSTALLLHARGETEAARELVAEELEPARRWGAARALGATLRAAGVVHGGERGIDLLQESATVLSGSAAELERARTLVELGSALRRRKRRAQAKDPLLQGLDLAHRCGALPLEERAREELVVLGARPRRALLSGVESLTAAELRVAKLAAEGHRNREIAQTLFVSLPTVEKHLSATYRKLDVTSRDELPRALADAG